MLKCFLQLLVSLVKKFFVLLHKSYMYVYIDGLLNNDIINILTHIFFQSFQEIAF